MEHSFKKCTRCKGFFEDPVRTTCERCRLLSRQYRKKEIEDPIRKVNRRRVQQEYRDRNKDKAKAWRLANKDKVRQKKAKQRDKARAERALLGLNYIQHIKLMKVLFAAGVDWSEQGTQGVLLPAGGNNRFDAQAGNKLE